jgi:GTP cyclohydrolase II
MGLKISDEADLPTKNGFFKIRAFKQGHKEHIAIYKLPLCNEPIVRIHSECLTGDALGSRKCDCGEQLDEALKIISQNGGMVLYLRQEGRDIGLLNKVNAYALQDKGLDTVEANHQLGFEADMRRYDIAEEILSYFKITKIKLLTNNPAKIKSLDTIEIVERIPLKIKPNLHNENYLNIKKVKLGHLD